MLGTTLSLYDRRRGSRSTLVSSIKRNGFLGRRVQLGPWEGESTESDAVELSVGSGGGRRPGDVFVYAEGYGFVEVGEPLPSLRRAVGCPSLIRGGFLQVVAGEPGEEV